MKNTIYVLEGYHRNKTIENPNIQTSKSYSTVFHKEGGSQLLKLMTLTFPGATKNPIRINLESENKLRDKAPEEAKAETDAETVERMRKRSTILDSMTKACKKGDVRAMIVHDPQVLEKSMA